VGGSGLYIDSVIYEYNFTTDRDASKRQELGQMSVEQLQEFCQKHNISLPENDKNKRYLIRQIERQGGSSDDRQRIRRDCVVVGITTDKNALQKRIAKRAEQMFTPELERETRFLAERYRFDLESMKSNIYQFAWQLINREISRQQAIELSCTDDWHLAKKQLTWFRRNPYIKWLSLDQAEHFLIKLLQNEQ
jgi:tRNA dimethylallyltransferase